VAFIQAKNGGGDSRSNLHSVETECRFDCRDRVELGSALLDKKTERALEVRIVARPDIVE
jgi:hypothetical protein